ncbi:DUF421 domain-containing protein [Henriciella marina]|uniref:DUF421 domain-containing protein n=1 Tax=Henriciella marina TaxID=453851 RepID=A0ABT4LQH4_9PROT|nr:YetF domain-containing protein [Henriciella marina]MCZ4296622.1 DUF421 domain-containing protein [Henriciella marina]
MMDWIATSWSAVGMVLLGGLGMYATVVLLTRIFGLRSFSKMSGFDFAVTVATGSILAAIFIAKDPPLLQGMAAMIILFAMQAAVAELRKRFSFVQMIVDNQPRLIMWGGEIDEKQMLKAKITRADLIAKLREANVTRFEQIHAVVAETTGDISVLHGPPEEMLELRLLDGVIGAERLTNVTSN